MVSVWLRTWRRSPLVTGQFAFTIAIGMGAASALVSLMLSLGYQPLPFRDPGRLVAVWERAESSGQVLAISGPDLADFADGTHSIFTSLGAITVPRVWLLDTKSATEIRECHIQAAVFVDLGIRALFWAVESGRTMNLWLSPVVPRQLGSATAFGRPAIVASQLLLA